MTGPCGFQLAVFTKVCVDVQARRAGLSFVKNEPGKMGLLVPAIGFAFGMIGGGGYKSRACDRNR